MNVIAILGFSLTKFLLVECGINYLTRITIVVFGIVIKLLESVFHGQRVRLVNIYIYTAVRKKEQHKNDFGKAAFATFGELFVVVLILAIRVL